MGSTRQWGSRPERTEGEAIFFSAAESIKAVKCIERTQIVIDAYNHRRPTLLVILSFTA